MALGPRLDLRQTQGLVMTPQLRQAIKLLQFTNVEVAAFVEEELERNPLLERDERGEAPPAERAALDQAPPTPPADSAAAAASDTIAADAPLDADYGNVHDYGTPADGYGRGSGGRSDFGDDERGIDDLAEAPRSLREHLGEQLRLSFGDPVDRVIGAQLIALLDPAGRLPVAPETLAEALGAPLERVKSVLARMQLFDPAGLFARDLRECLALQLADRNRLDPYMERLLDNLDLLARRDMKALRDACGVDAEDLAEMVAELRRLDPKPGASFDAVPATPTVPDVLMRRGPDGEWILELNPETLPRVLVSQEFRTRVAPGLRKEDRVFVTEKLASANWLVKSLEQRAQTILKVATEIVRQQDGFFRHGVQWLRPLILRDIAEAVELHESTISRVTANKRIATPRGIFELKYFFTAAISGTTAGLSHSAEAVRFRIRALIDAEAPDDILSDDTIVTLLRREGVDIARRTVAKYREAMRIASSVQRKREKAALVV